MMLDADEYLTLSEAADMLAALRISRRTLQRYAADGRLDAVRVGRDYRIPRSTVDRVKTEGLLAVVGVEGES
jgi:excisionase family DNA binding protein